MGQAIRGVVKAIGYVEWHHDKVKQLQHLLLGSQFATRSQQLSLTVEDVSIRSPDVAGHAVAIQADEGRVVPVQVEEELDGCLHGCVSARSR